MLSDLETELKGQPPLSLRFVGAVPPQVYSGEHEACDDGECVKCDAKVVAMAFALFIRRCGGTVEEIRFDEHGQPDILISWGDRYQILGPGAAMVSGQ